MVKDTLPHSIKTKNVTEIR